MREVLDVPPFGDLPFDEFILQEQKRCLLHQWIQLGKFGRNEYCTEPRLRDEIPPNTPADILSDPDRAVDGQISRTLWIRTWFGLPDNKQSQDAADAAYERLFLEGMQQGDSEYGLPLYLFTALLHYPDQFDGVTTAEVHHAKIEKALREGGEEREAKRQCLLVLVADRKACEEEWVLHLAVNHKGRVLPFRARDAASYVSDNVGNWGEGEPLQANTEAAEGQEEECYMRDGSGWD
ncbi:hypothetical protein BDW59DRAFT_171854 [Aspergillus cavernicola]|uniref:Uncharacterized protein n=1 Tax=Aspergillus cavernicola TaxID=176166 RepID=A0ABR4IFT9_9EURO